MATAGMIALATTTLASSTSSITFSSIPTSGYRDLMLVFEGTVTVNGGVLATINGDTSVSRVYMYGSDATEAYGTSEGQEVMFAQTVRSAARIHFFDYAETDKHKAILSRSGSANTSFLNAHRWASTSAITSIELSNRTFTTGSRFSLYGILGEVS